MAGRRQLTADLLAVSCTETSASVMRSNDGVPIQAPELLKDVPNGQRYQLRPVAASEITPFLSVENLDP